ncbi:UDP-3-O-[3-hydroxymyristoyl] N-acetylglucosamine deacetylase [Bombella sp. ESL0378]|uniref:UDP-3-O-acyl-N-acetylglucosamine deacetylase n=1 Tax=Bombella sp. ESL0378 TaxID=2676442 RepID=UPI0012D9D4A0|nr:UDP-3-O-[3-hydroxymyristoyl] N-acetylglucosamine deacetylase [Bombella sp. ESL0378]
MPPTNIVDAPHYGGQILPHKGKHDPAQQTTLAHAIHCRGVGLHSGRPVTLRLSPAPADTGLHIQRLDRPDARPFRLTSGCIMSSPLATVAASPHQSDLHVATIEHLLAALHACKIDNLLIQLDGPELPILDGCAASFIFLLEAAGRTYLNAPRHIIAVRQPISVEGENGAYARLLPHHQNQLHLSLSIDFPAPAIGQQSYALTLDKKHFKRDIAFARTFVNYEDIGRLHAQGLALGGSLENALVIQHDHALNPGGMRHVDECVRHKMLDAIGDLYCTGYSLAARFEAHKTGHSLNNQLLRALFASRDNWQFVKDFATILPLPHENIGLKDKNTLPLENSHAIRKSWSAAS